MICEVVYVEIFLDIMFSGEYDLVKVNIIRFIIEYIIFMMMIVSFYY